MDYVQSDASIMVDTKPVLRLRMSPNNVPELSKVKKWFKDCDCICKFHQIASEH